MIFWSQLCFYHLVLLAFIDYFAKFWSKNPSFVAVSRKFDSIFEYFKVKRVTNSSAIKASGSRNQFWNSTTKPKLLQHQADKNYKICLKHIYMLNFNKIGIFHNHNRIIGLFFDLILFTLRPFLPYSSRLFPSKTGSRQAQKLQLHQLLIICLALAWKLIKKRVV